VSSLELAADMELFAFSDSQTRASAASVSWRPNVVTYPDNRFQKSDHRSDELLTPAIDRRCSLDNESIASCLFLWQNARPKGARGNRSASQPCEHPSLPRGGMLHADYQYAGGCS
jgi:hypothetical protein